jgi:hypothetical protein
MAYGKRHNKSNGGVTGKVGGQMSTVSFEDAKNVQRTSGDIHPG